MVHNGPILALYKISALSKEIGAGGAWWLGVYNRGTPTMQAPRLCINATLNIWADAKIDSRFGSLLFTPLPRLRLPAAPKWSHGRPKSWSRRFQYRGADLRDLQDLSRYEILEHPNNACWWGSKSKKIKTEWMAQPWARFSTVLPLATGPGMGYLSEVPVQVQPVRYVRPWTIDDPSERAVVQFLYQCQTKSPSLFVQ